MDIVEELNRATSHPKSIRIITDGDITTHCNLQNVAH
jgi:hypothetical protein